MSAPLPSSSLPLIGVLLPAMLVLGGLLLGYRGEVSGRQAPEAEILLTDYTGMDPAVVAAQPMVAWRRLGEPGLVQGPTPLVRWVRVTLPNTDVKPRTGVLADVARYADRADLFLRDERTALLRPGYAGQASAPAEAWRHLRSGEWTPAAEKALWGRETAFPVVVPPRTTVTAYVRYEDRLALWLEPGWWPEGRRFHAAVLRDIAAESAYFGALLALLLYNAVLWLRVRLPYVGAYLLYLATFIAYVFLALSEAVLLGLPLGSPVMEGAVTVLLALSGACLAAFARRFLELAERLPRADRVARGVQGTMLLLALVGGLAPMTGSGDLFSLIVFASATTHVVLFAVAVIAWRVGAGQARPFVVAFGFLFIGLAPLLVAWLPAVSLGLIARMVMTSSALEMLLLSLAIADRFAVLQQEKIAAQAAAMAEAERRHRMQEIYAGEIEQEVRERTRELAAANADKDRMMAVLGHDLRSPLTALTLAAEQTPVREGLAQEVAQTGRRLLLLLEDVVLWTRLRAGGGRPGGFAASAVVAPAVELHQALAAQRGVRLEVQAEPGLRVLTDLVPAQTLVRNLISNAVKAAQGRVWVTVQGGERGVRVSVRDDGPGLPPAALGLLQGRPLPRGSGEPWGQGGGLGLRLGLEIAQVLGTRLEAVTGDQGTEIGFTLPRADA